MISVLAEMALFYVCMIITCLLFPECHDLFDVDLLVNNHYIIQNKSHLLASQIQQYFEHMHIYLSSGVEH